MTGAFSEVSFRLSGAELDNYRYGMDNIYVILLWKDLNLH